LAQFPEILEGTIFPLSEISGFKAFISSKAMNSALSAQNRQILWEKKERFLVFELTVTIIIHSKK